MKSYKFLVNGQSYEVNIKAREGSKVSATVNGVDYSLTLDETSVPAPTSPVKVSKTVAAAATPKTPQVVQSAPKAVSPGAVLAPIPGQIKSIAVKEGDSVTKGQKLLVMEAMKLENEITATKAGRIEKVLVKPSDVVNQDQELVRIGE